ncbi:MAG: hypothetical protein IAE90_02125 [Ignavibacteria bacterium]|nr:hypothetical protein [Ignavibacteria bacterium]
MDNTILKEEKPCAFEDLAKLEVMMCKAKRELRFAGIFILILSIILPLLPPKYSGTNGMLDIMSYSSAVSGIVVVMAIVFLWSVYFMLYGLYKDLKFKTKLRVSTYVTSTGKTKYRGKEYYSFSAAGLPYSLSRIPMNENESRVLKTGERVTVEYSKFGKKYLGRIET